MGRVGIRLGVWVMVGFGNERDLLLFFSSGFFCFLLLEFCDPLFFVFNGPNVNLSGVCGESSKFVIIVTLFQIPAFYFCQIE